MCHYARDFSNKKKGKSEGEGEDANIHLVTGVETSQLGDYEEYGEFYFIQEGHSVKLDWVLLGSQSTVYVF